VQEEIEQLVHRRDMLKQLDKWHRCTRKLPRLKIPPAFLKSMSAVATPLYTYA